MEYDQKKIYDKTLFTQDTFSSLKPTSALYINMTRHHCPPCHMESEKKTEMVKNLKWRARKNREEDKKCVKDSYIYLYKMI
jgi:hypothetical protein